VSIRFSGRKIEQVKCRDLEDKFQRIGLICVFGTRKIWTVSTLGIKFYVKIWGSAVGQSIVKNFLRYVPQINPNNTFFPPMPPPHVLVDFMVLPPGHGRNVTDF